MQNSETYVRNVLRTDTPVTQEVIDRHSNPETIRLIHAAMGMVTESAELMDMLKRHLFYGTAIDYVNAKEELGDNQWYVGLAIDILKTTMDDILTLNISKLRLRYPDKFDETAALNRDLSAERELLEIGHVTKKEDTTEVVSERGRDWIEFSKAVLYHIENYTVPQYGDKGNDQASEWSIEMLIEQTKKYANRYGRNSRQGQECLDFMKGAHYLQMAMTKFKEVVENETDKRLLEIFPEVEKYLPQGASVHLPAVVDISKLRSLLETK